MNKEDLKQITNVVAKEIEKSEKRVDGKMDLKIEKLAQIIAKGFEGVDKRIEEVDKKLENIDKRLDKIEYEVEEMKSDIKYLEASVREIRRDLNEIKQSFVSKTELENLEIRVRFLETKLGVKIAK